MPLRRSSCLDIAPFLCDSLVRYLVHHAGSTINELIFDERTVRVSLALLDERRLSLMAHRHKLLTLLLTERSMRTTAQAKSGILRHHLSTVKRTVAKLNAHNAEIKQLLAKRTSHYDQDTNNQGINFASLQGKLPLPVKGTVLTQKTTDAISIRAYTPTVHAVADGQVVYAGSLGTLGLTVMLAHGQGYYSAYGLLDKIVHTEGQQVQAGDAIAALAPQSLLYFALRKNNKALNPRYWLTN